MFARNSRQGEPGPGRDRLRSRTRLEKEQRGEWERQYHEAMVAAQIEAEPWAEAEVGSEREIAVTMQKLGTSRAHGKGRTTKKVDHTVGDAPGNRRLVVQRGPSQLGWHEARLAGKNQRGGDLLLLMLSSQASHLSMGVMEFQIQRTFEFHEARLTLTVTLLRRALLFKPLRRIGFRRWSGSRS